MAKGLMTANELIHSLYNLEFSTPASQKKYSIHRAQIPWPIINRAVPFQYSELMFL